MWHAIVALQFCLHVLKICALDGVGLDAPMTQPTDAWSKVTLRESMGHHAQSPVKGRRPIKARLVEWQQPAGGIALDAQTLCTAAHMCAHATGLQAAPLTVNVRRCKCNLCSTPERYSIASSSASPLRNISESVVSSSSSCSLSWHSFIFARACLLLGSRCTTA